MKKSCAYTTILFDLDGTLTNPKIGITKSVQYALKKMNIQEDNLDNLIKYIGPPLRDSFCEYHHLTAKQSEQAVAYYREYYQESGIYENVAYNGITDLLALLVDSKKQLFVATSKPRVYAEKIINHFKLGSYFVAVEGSELDGTKSDKGELIGGILKKYQLEQTSTLMIGDRKYDIIGAAKNAIDSVAVGYGYGNDEELQNAHATYYFKTLQELKAFFSE